MDHHSSYYGGDESPTCSFNMMDCFNTEKRERNAHKRASRRIGVERQMRVTYNQPHLVEPMKLTVYDDLPMTPLPPTQSQISKIVSQGRRSMSRASTRASISTRKRAYSRPSISKPLPIMSASTVPLRRNPSFRPLQLSIYVSDQRLSDLPVFDRLSFTEDGSIKPPPRALIRTQSEELLRSECLDLPNFMPGKPASMFEQSLSRRISHVRRDTDSTLVSSSRPVSEYDALRSHPVSWYAMPGLPPQIHMAAAPEHSRTMLSPMQEEFTPPPSGAVLINGKILAFPDIDASRVQTEEAYSSLLPPAPGQESESACPSPTINPGPTQQTMVITKHKSKISQAATILLASSANSTRTRANTSASLLQPTVSALQLAQMPADLPTEQPRPYFHTNYATHSRINQWLDTERLKAEPKAVEEPIVATTNATPARPRDSSVSTVDSGVTNSTASSFAEHRRKRSEFYQLNTKPTSSAAPTDITSPTSTTGTSPKTYTRPASLKLYKPFPSQTAIAGQENAQLPAARIPPTNTNTNLLRHRRSKSSFTLENPAFTQAHSRTVTNSTVASTIETDDLFEDPESPEERFHSARALLQRHIAKTSARMQHDDAGSMTTIDMKSRTGTVKSTDTSSSPIEQCADTLESPLEEVHQPAEQGFVFKGTTPSPVTPGRQCDDVEKMMFEMCAQSGFRRVNVGIAF